MAKDSDDVPLVWNWLQDIPPCEKALVWCHTTSAYFFREMVESGECRLRPCKFFHEDLLYFFYGRPAYRLDDEPMAKAASQPVVLLFHPDLVDTGKRLFPFDSGAFHEKLLDRWMHPEMRLSAFALRCAMEGALRFVAAFFDSNDNYLRTRVRGDIKKHGGDFEVHALVRMFVAAADGNPQQPADDRRMAMELQLDRAIPLRSADLVGVIYPDELDESDWFRSFRSGCRQEVQWKEYKPQACKMASHYLGTLEEKAHDMQAQMGVI